MEKTEMRTSQKQAERMVSNTSLHICQLWYCDKWNKIMLSILSAPGNPLPPRSILHLGIMSLIVTANQTSVKHAICSVNYWSSWPCCDKGKTRKLTRVAFFLLTASSISASTSARFTSQQTQHLPGHKVIQLTTCVCLILFFFFN